MPSSSSNLAADIGLTRRRHALAHSLRWAVPGALLVGEYLALSWMVDLPELGTGARLAAAVRLVLPVIVGAGAAGWLLARPFAAAAAPGALPPLPAWRPWPALSGHLLAVALTAAWGHVLLREREPVATAVLVAWLACAGIAAVLALASAAPLRWVVGIVVARWRAPILALALGVLFWRVTVAAEGFWAILSTQTLESVAWLLGAFAHQVRVDPAQKIIGLRGFDVLIASTCSGADGIGLVAIFQVVWLSLARRRLRVARALLLLPVGAALAFGGNVLRITALIVSGASGQAELALRGFHSKLGWFFFLAIAVGSVAVAERLPWLARERTAADENDTVPRAAAAYVAPLLAALTTALLTSIWAEDAIDAWYWARILAASAVLFLVRGSVPRPAVAPSPVPVVVALAVAAAWIASPGGDPHPLSDALSRLDPGARAAWIAVRLLGSVVVIPVVEELAFRGFLLPWLVSADFEHARPRAWSVSSVLLSSLAFGSLHPSWSLGAVAGAGFALARLHRGRLGDAIVAHVLCNAGIAAAVLLGGRWDLWS